jgi:hypothetical protein
MAKSIGEWIDEVMLSKPQLRHGNSEYRPGNNVILLHLSKPTGRIYEVDLDRCTTAAQALDWILHISKKTWCEGDTLLNFTRCLDAACHHRHGMSAFSYFDVAGALTARTSHPKQP